MRGGVTFSVHDVEPADEALPAFDGRSLLMAASWADGVPLVTSFRPEDELIPLDRPNLVTAVQLAYAHHYPLVLSPDIIWLTIAHGFSIHIRLHAEQLRRDLVRHEGQRELAVSRGLALTNLADFWAGLVSEFAAKVGSETGELHDLIVCDFSTTGAIERTASELVLMDAASPYFHYSTYIICGIPSITLEGEPGDWERLRSKVERLQHYGLAAWTKRLLPICDEFVRAARGDVNREFWQAIFYEHRGCDPEATISGWVTTFYPYLNGPGEYLPSKVLTTGEAYFKMGAVPSDVSHVLIKLVGAPGLSGANLVSGILGVTQDPEDLSLRPAIGWATLVPRQDLVPLAHQASEANASDSLFSEPDVEALLTKWANAPKPTARSPKRRAPKEKTSARGMVDFLPPGPTRDIREVFEDFKKQVASQLSEPDAGTHYDLGVAYAEMSMPRDALEEFAKAARSPRYECMAYTASGRLHREMQSLDQAIHAFQKALAADRKSPDQEYLLYYELGDALAAQKRPSEALQCFAYLSHICPDYKDPRGNPLERVERLERGLE